MSLEQQKSTALTPIEVISQAVAGGNISIDVMEKLMAMKEKHDAQIARRNFNHAMSLFQAEKPSIHKSEKVSYNKTEYYFAPLAKIQKQVDPILTKFGLSYSWRQEEIDGKLKITFVLKHEDGHEEETFLSSGTDNSGNKNSIQAIGSAVSYLKRYTLCNGLGISPDSDDDGQSSSPNQEDLIEIAKQELMELYLEAEDNLSDLEKRRLNHVISTREVPAFKKAINFLKDKIQNGNINELKKQYEAIYNEGLKSLKPSDTVMVGKAQIKYGSLALLNLKYSDYSELERILEKLKNVVESQNVEA